MIYVGGDTQTITYIPDYLTAVETSPVITIKKANGGIDPANPPAPTDAVWVTITDQATLDKLKSQNENPIVLSGADGRTITVAGQTLVQQSASNPAIRDDFAGKQAGSTTVNPNTFKYATPTTSLEVPSSSKFVENSQSSIDRIGVQDGTTTSTQRNNAGEIPQLLLSYNLIREVEDRGLTIPGATTAEKVAWLIKNVSNTSLLRLLYYGICPTGNLAKIALWRADTSQWMTTNSSASTTASSPQEKTYPFSAHFSKDQMGMCIDANGFVHFLVYTDAARTTDSTLLVLSGHGLIAEDVVFNVNRNTYAIVSATGLATNSLIINASIAGQVAGDTINKYKKAGANKTAEAGTTETNVTIANHGLATGDFVYNMSRGAALRRVTVVDANNFTLSSAVTGQVAGDLIRPITFIGTQTAEATVIPSTVYLDYANIDLQFKAPAGYDIYVSPNPRRDAGAGYVVQMTKVYDNITDGAGTDGITNFKNKVSGEATACPHKAFRLATSNSLQPPSGFTTEISSAEYGKLNTLDAVSSSTSPSSAGIIAQYLFSMNVIEEVKRKFGWTQLPITYTGNGATDLANEVAWCKANISKLTCKWWGFGSCPSGNKAYIDWWRNTGYWYLNYTNSKESGLNTANSVTLTSAPLYRPDFAIMPDGSAHFLAYTDASDGVTASQINTDYVSLDIEFVKPNTASLFFTGNSVEVENVTAGKASAMLIEFDMTPVCNALVSGDNAAFKALLKSITADVWAKGEGANAGSLGYGCKLQGFRTTWYEWLTNSTSSIAKISSSSSTQSYIQGTNKVYFMIHSQYPSDATIASQLSLDYFSLKVDFTRIADTVAAKQVYLPNEWTMVVQGFSPMWDSTLAVGKHIVNIGIDINNRYSLYYGSTAGNFRLFKNKEAIADGSTLSISESFAKNKIINFIIYQKNGYKGIKMLSNNGTIKTAEDATIAQLNGMVNIYIMQVINGGSQADALASRFALIPRAVSDTEAENILKGLQAGFTMPNLVPAFSDARWVKHANAVVNADGSLTYSPTDGYQNNIVDIPVLPNNRYTLSVSDMDANTRISVDDYTNSSRTRIDSVKLYPGANQLDFTTLPNTNNVRIICYSLSAGTFTFYPVSLKLKM